MGRELLHGRQMQLLPVERYTPAAGVLCESREE